MTRVTKLFAIVLVTTFILGCSGGPEDTVVPREPTAPAALGPPVFSASAQGATVFKFRSKGAFASVSWEDENLFGFLFVTLGQSQEGGKPVEQAFLSYFIIECDGNFCDFSDPVEDGFGRIPIEDVSGNGRKSFSLHTDTSTNPDFLLFAGSGGPVDVDWTANDLFSGSGHGVSQFQSGDTKIKSNGSSSFTSATAMGSVVGSSVEASFAEIGTNHDRNMEIIR